MAKTLTKEEVEEWQRAQEKPEAQEPVPTEQEELEAAGKFKVTKNQTKGPRIMTPEQVRQESPQPSYQQAQPEQRSEDYWPEHQTIEIVRKKHVSEWKEDVYEAIIEKTWTSEDPDYYNKGPDGSPGVRTFLHVGFKTTAGNIKRRMSLNYNEGSVLRGLIEVIWGEAPEGLTTDDLVGKQVRIMVKNEPNPRGDVWPVVKEFLPSTSQFKAGG